MSTNCIDCFNLRCIVIVSNTVDELVKLASSHVEIALVVLCLGTHCIGDVEVATRGAQSLLSWGEEASLSIALTLFHCDS